MAAPIDPHRMSTDGLRRSHLRLESWHEGPVGSGQGGLAAQRFCAAVGHNLSVRFHSPIPLDTDLAIGWVAGEDGRRRWLAHHDGAVILSGRQRHFEAHPTTAVSLTEARQARHRTTVFSGRNGAPSCFCCGIHDDSMGVHPGPLADGRWATDFTPPDWAVTDAGVDLGVVWAALDCTAAHYVAADPGREVVVTGQYEVNQLVPHITPGPLVMVAYDPVTGTGQNFGWQGRKRSAASAAFTADGTLVAEANSLWISIEGSES